MFQESDPSQASASAVFVKTFDSKNAALRVAIKDTFDQQGEVTACGSRALENAPPAKHNAHIVDAFEKAGCHIVGRANMHELAYGVTGVNSWRGTPINPSYPELIPGGSSSGSAVSVAAELADIAIGTDTGGSVRVPAACDLPP